MKVLTLCALLALSLSAQTFPTVTPLPAPIGLASSACVPGFPLILSFNVSGLALGVNDLNVNFTCAPAHTFYGDVRMVVTNPALASIIMLQDGCTPAGFSGDDSDLGGPYTISDGVFPTLDVAATTVSTNVAIPPGTYGPDNAINSLVSTCNPNGLWTVTVTDWFPGDTGTLASMSLQFSTSGIPLESYTLCQAYPGAPLTARHLGGIPGGYYCNPVTATLPGNYPGGYFFGLNVPIYDLLGQLTSPTFFGITHGQLNSFGAATFSVNVPPSLSIDHVGVHFNLFGVPSFISSPTTYVTL